VLDELAAPVADLPAPRAAPVEQSVDTVVRPWQPAASATPHRSAAYAPVSITAEARGKARDLRRRVEREDGTYIATVHAVVEPVRDRLRRFPRRHVRPQMLIDLVQQWRFMPCRDYRLDLEAQLERKRLALVERRLVAGQMKLEGWPDAEPDIGIGEVALLIDGAHIRVQTRTVCAFSLHAVARRYQRNPDGDDAAMLFDMDVVARIDQAALSGGGFKVTTHQDGGGWRGRVVRVQDRDGERVPVLSIRTWMPE
jgi:hypothetical protein